MFIFRTLFIVYDNGTLSSLSLLTYESYTYKGGKSGLQNVGRVALDLEKQLIYATTTTPINTGCIVWIDYADTTLTTIYENAELSYRNRFDVYKDSIVWECYNIIYSCQLTPTCKQRDVKQHLKKSDKVS